jgi:hypothetical protein
MDASTPGSYTGSVTFGTNDPNNTPFDFSISGTVSAEIPTSLAGA